MSSENFSQIENELNEVNQLVQIPPLPSNPTASQLASYYSNLVNNYTQAISILQQVLKQLPPTANVSDIQNEINELQQYLQYFQALYNYYNTIAQAPTEFTGSIDQQIQEVQDALNLYQEALSYIANLNLQDQTLQENIETLVSTTQQQIQYLQNLLNALKQLNVAYGYINQANQILANLPQPSQGMTPSQLAQLYNQDATELENALQLLQKALPILQQVNQTIDVSQTISSVQNAIQQLQSNIQLATSLVGFYNGLAQLPPPPQTNHNEQVDVSLGQYIQYTQEAITVIQNALQNLTSNQNVANNPQVQQLIKAYQEQIQQLQTQLQQLKYEKNIYDQYVVKANQYIAEANSDISEAESLLSSASSVNLAQVSQLFQQASQYFAQAYQLLSQAYNQAQADGLTDTAQSLQSALQQLQSAQQTAELLAKFYDMENKISQILNELNAQMNSQSPPSPAQIASTYNNILSILTAFSNSISSYPDADPQTVQSIEEMVNSQWQKFSLVEQGYAYLASNLPRPPNIPSNPDLSQLPSIYSEIANYYAGVAKALQGADLYFIQANNGQDTLTNEIQQYQELAQAFTDASEVASLINSGDFQGALRLSARYYSIYGDSLTVNGQTMQLPFKTLNLIAQLMYDAQQLNQIIKQAEDVVNNATTGQSSSSNLNRFALRHISPGGTSTPGDNSQGVHVSELINALNQAINLLESKALPLAQEIDQLQNQLSGNTSRQTVLHARPSITPGVGLGSQPQSTVQFVQELIDLFRNEKDAVETEQQLNEYISKANSYANQQDYQDAISALQEAIQQANQAITYLNSCVTIAQELNDQNAVQSFQQSIQSLQNTVQNLQQMITQLQLIQQFNQGVRQAKKLMKQGDYSGAIQVLQGLQNVAQQLTQLMQNNGNQGNQLTPVQILNDLIQLNYDFVQANILLQQMQNYLQQAVNIIQGYSFNVKTQIEQAYFYAQSAETDLQTLLNLQNEINQILSELAQGQPYQPVQFLKPDQVVAINNFYNQLEAEYQNVKGLNNFAGGLFAVFQDIVKGVNQIINYINDNLILGPDGCLKNPNAPGCNIAEATAGFVDGIIFALLSVLTGGVFDVVYGIAFLGDLAFTVKVTGESVFKVASDIFHYMFETPQGIGMLIGSAIVGGLAGIAHAFDDLTAKLPKTLRDFSEASDPLKIAKGLISKIADRLKARIPEPEIIDVKIENNVVKITTNVGNVVKSIKDVGKDIKTLDDLDKFIKNFQDLKSAIDFINKLKLKAKEFSDVAIKAQVEKVNVISLKVEETVKDVTIQIEKDLQVGKIEGVEKLPPEKGLLKLNEENLTYEWKTLEGKTPGELSQQVLGEVEKIFGKPGQEIHLGKFETKIGEQRVEVGKVLELGEGGAEKVQTGTLEKQTTGVAGNYVTQVEKITSEKNESGFALGNPLNVVNEYKTLMSSEPLGVRLYDYFERLKYSGKLDLSDADMKLLKAFLETKTERGAVNLTDVADKVLNEFEQLKENLLDTFKNWLEEKGLNVSDVDELFDKLVLNTNFSKEDLYDPTVFTEDLMKTLVNSQDKYGLLDQISSMAEQLYKKYNISLQQAYDAVYEFLTSDRYDSLDSLARSEGWSLRTTTSQSTTGTSQSGQSQATNNASTTTSQSTTGTPQSSSAQGNTTTSSGQGQNVPMTSTPQQTTPPNVSVPGSSPVPNPTKSVESNTAVNKGTGAGTGTALSANGLTLLLKNAPEAVEKLLTRIPLRDIVGPVLNKLGDLATDFKSLPQDIQDGLIVSALDKLGDSVKDMSLDQLIDEVAKFVRDELPDVKDALDRLDLVKEVKDFKLENYAEEQIMKNPTEATTIADATIKYAKTLDNLLKVLDILGPTVLRSLGLTTLASSLETGSLTSVALSQLYQLGNAFVSAGYFITQVLPTPQIKANIMKVLRGIETGTITSIDQIAQVLGVPVQALKGFTTPKEVYYALQELLDDLTNLDKYVFIEVDVSGITRLGVIVPLSTGIELITLNPPTITSGTSYYVSTNTSSTSITTSGTSITTGTSTGTEIYNNTTTTPEPIQTRLISEQEVSSQLTTPLVAPPPEPNEVEENNGNNNNNNGITPSPNIGFITRPPGSTRGYNQVLTL